MSTKGKERDMNDIQVDVSLKAFIKDQIEALQTALVVPVQEDLECTDREHRGVERAVKTIKCEYIYILPHDTDPFVVLRLTRF